MQLINPRTPSTPCLLDQINTTKDTSDLLWYTTSINVEENIKKRKAKLQLIIGCLGHAALVFVNKKPVGVEYEEREDERSEDLTCRYLNCWSNFRVLGIFCQLLKILKFSL